MGSEAAEWLDGVRDHRWGDSLQKMDNGQKKNGQVMENGGEKRRNLK